MARRPTGPDTSRPSGGVPRLLVVVAAVVAAGCAAQAAAPEAVLYVTDQRMEPAAVNVEIGRDLRVDNESSSPCTLTAVAAGQQLASVQVAPGAASVLDTGTLQQGSYRLLCAQDGRLDTLTMPERSAVLLYRNNDGHDHVH